MEMPDVIFAGEKIYPNDYGAEWMEKDGLGREKYYHSRIVEALRRENDQLRKERDVLADGILFVLDYGDIGETDEQCELVETIAKKLRNK